MKPKNIWTNIATLGPVGFMKPAPGTWGSLVAVFMALVLRFYLTQPILWTIFGVVFLVSWYAVHFTEVLWMGHDHAEIVIDELLGVWLVCFLWPPKPWGFVAIFLIFRFFDILKPWPIGAVDKKMKSSLGTIVDDLLAGAFTLGVMMVLRIFVKVI